MASFLFVLRSDGDLIESDCGAISYFAFLSRGKSHFLFASFLLELWYPLSYEPNMCPLLGHFRDPNGRSKYFFRVHVLVFLLLQLFPPSPLLIVQGAISSFLRIPSSLFFSTRLHWCPSRKCFLCWSSWACVYWHVSRLQFFSTLHLYTHQACSITTQSCEGASQQSHYGSCISTVS